MRIVAAVLLMAYSLLVGHETGHGPGDHLAVHAGEGHSHLFEADHSHEAAPACGDSCESRAAREAGKPEPQARPECCEHQHEHSHYQHVHPSLASRAAKVRQAEAPAAPVIALPYSTVELLLNAPSAAQLAAGPSRRSPPAYLTRLILRI